MGSANDAPVGPLLRRQQWNQLRLSHCGQPSPLQARVGALHELQFGQQKSQVIGVDTVAATNHFNVRVGHRQCRRRQGLADGSQPGFV